MADIHKYNTIYSPTDNENLQPKDAVFYTFQDSGLDTGGCAGGSTLCDAGNII